MQYLTKLCHFECFGIEQVGRVLNVRYRVSEWSAHTTDNFFFLVLFFLARCQILKLFEEHFSSCYMCLFFVGSIFKLISMVIVIYVAKPVTVESKYV